VAVCPATTPARSAAAARWAAPDVLGAGAGLVAVEVAAPVAAQAGRRNSYPVLVVDELVGPAVFPGRVGGIRPVPRTIKVCGVRLAAEAVP
jgi:hypothetical protein